MNKLKWAALPLSALILLACGGGGSDAGTSAFLDSGAGTPGFGSGGSTAVGGTTGDGPRPAADPTVVVSLAAVQGQVLNSTSGAAISGATVEFPNANLTTDAAGFFEQSTYAATSRLIQRASSTGYEDIFVPTPVVTGVPSVTLLKLTPQGTSGNLTGPTGGTVVNGSGPGEVTFDPNALVDSGGAVSAAGGAVRLTTLDVRSDTFMVSGDYTSSTGEVLEAFGAAVLTNAANLAIDPAIPATLHIPLSTRITAPPATAHLYYLDAATATWIQDGTATLVSNGAAGAYYEGKVTRFGQWLVGEAVASPVQVKGCVQDDAGNAVANARIVAEGISYSGLAYAQTDANGLFSVPAKRTSQIIVTGHRGVVLTNAVSVTTTTVDATLSTCLTLPSSNAATVRLTWGASPLDLDSHLRIPGGAHVYYIEKGLLTAEPFASLDVDDVTSFGPEITTIRRPKVGIYRFYVHNFSQTFNPGMTGSPARVELNYLGRTVAFTPPAGEQNSLYWHVFDVEVAADCSMTLYRYNRFRSDEPANPNTATTAQACVPS